MKHLIIAALAGLLMLGPLGCRPNTGEELNVIRRGKL